MNKSQLDSIFSGEKTVHLAGIGGVSMRALARYLHRRGAKVQGSDRSESEHTKALESEGIRVFIGQRAENIAGAGLLIRTAAVDDQNAEIAAAKRGGVPVLERADTWGMLMKNYKQAVCVAGTHGKTTVTGMISLVALEAQTDPVIMVGGDLAQIGGTLRDGAGELYIAEACEYKNSFLSFFPGVAVILNIDDDHMDFFSGTDDIIDSFRRFAALTPKEGTVVVNRGDERAMRCVRDLDREILTFGMDSSADIYPENIVNEGGLYRFDVVFRGKKYANAALSVPGRHSVSNALAAAAAAIALDISGTDFAGGIAKFTGVSRRFEYKKTWRGAHVYDDYAHHPNEIAAMIETARSLKPSRLICVFQPHTYTRTKAFMNEFADALGKGDKNILCPIFAAREAEIEGVNSRVLAQLSGGQYADSLECAAQILKKDAREGDIILIMGAGDVNRLCDLLD